MELERLRDGWSVVTGAGSGIGRACAEALAGRGSHLALCDRDEAALEQVATRLRAQGRHVLTQKVDVAQRGEMAAFAARIHGECEAVDLLVNNAGVALGAFFLDATLDDWDWILDINVKGVVHGCHFFLPPMLARGRGGHIVNIASMAGYLGGPSLSAYCATKSAVIGLSEALREEMRPRGIGVTALCPGVINTPIVHNARRRGKADDEEASRAFVAMFEKRNYPPERVAKKMLRAVARNRGLAPVTAEAWIFYLLKRLSPRAALAASRWFEPPAARRVRLSEND